MSHSVAMGLINAIRMTRYQSAIGASLDPSTLPIASPWGGPSHLQRLVAEDVFGSDMPVNTRAAAMRIPAVARGRNLLVSTICRLPLVSLSATQLLPRRPATTAPAAEWQTYADELGAFNLGQPSWLYRTDDGTSPELRLAWTVDDLIFYGASCWWRRNGSDRFPLTAGRINQADWSIDEDNRVVVDGVPQDDRDVILFYGLHEGVLTHGVDAIRDARQLQAIVRKRLKNPIPAIDLHYTGATDLTDPQIDALVERWAKARDGENGGVGFTNKWVEAKEMGKDGDAQLMIEARNAASLDLARMIGVSAGRLDATTPKASLNYETTTGRNQEFIDFDLALYMTPITARLSMDDCVPRGSRVAFDLSDFIASAPSVTGPSNQD